jgi:hypothetical protein
MQRKNNKYLSHKNEEITYTEDTQALKNTYTQTDSNVIYCDLWTKKTVYWYIRYSGSWTSTDGLRQEAVSLMTIITMQKRSDLYEDEYTLDAYCDPDDDCSNY